MKAQSGRLREFLESVPFASFALDGDSSHVVVWNQAAEHVFGWAENEVVGRNVPLTADYQFIDLHGLLGRARLGEPIAGVETVWVGKPGNRIHLAIWVTSLARLDTASPVWLVFAQDLTATKRLEEQLLQAQKMESLGRLAGGLAHDLNNLHTVISGYGQMLEEQMNTKKGSAAGKRSYIVQILQASDRASTLISQLLAFSRRQVLQPKTLNCNELICRVERLLRRLIGEDIDLVTTLCPDLASITADPGHLEQVLMNLAVNARDAMPDGGTLTIATEVVHRDESAFLTKAGDSVRITVADTGIGMDEALRQRIFEPFFTTKDQGKGTGLGLSIVYGIVKQSGGDIVVQSEPGAGTRVQLYFPVAAEPVEVVREAKSASEAEVVGGRETILVVEDEAPVRKFVRDVLQRRGYRVLVAGSGQEALRMAKGHESEIHLLLTDVVMPKISGPQLARRLAKVAPGAKVLFMSAYTATHTGIPSEEGAFLPKPFTPSLLAQKVREVLRGEPRLIERGKPLPAATRARRLKKEALSRRSRRARRD